MTFPSLEVLVPCFNEELNLEATIESILNASTKWPGKFNLLISDNQSVDGTQKIIKNYEKDQRVITFINKSNLGGKQNFFKLYALSTADYIMFMGAHDQISINFFEEIAKKIDISAPKILAGVEKQLSKTNGDWQISAPIHETYSFSKYRFLRMTKAILFLHKSTEFHSVIPRKLLLDKQIINSRSLAIDHLILYVLLAECNLEYVNDAFYVRRYDENVGDFYARVNSSGEIESRLERAKGNSEIPSEDRHMGFEIFRILKGRVGFTERIVYMVLLNSKNSVNFLIRTPYRGIRFLVSKSRRTKKFIKLSII